MAKHFISVCIFCILCATHSPCESHAEVTHKTTSNDKSKEFMEVNNPPVIQSDQDYSEKGLPYSTALNEKALDHNLSALNFSLKYHKRNNNSIKSKRIKRNSNSDNKINENNKYLNEIFAKYGDGKTMTMEGFEKFLSELDLVSKILHDKVDPARALKHLAASISHETENMTDSNVTCLNSKELLSTVSRNVSNSTLSKNINIDDKTLQRVCPAILYSMVTGKCLNEEIVHMDHLVESVVQSNNVYVSAWLYSLLAVVVISACGILGLAVIPVMQKRYYQQLIQFLVALAVGTLAGDALLHLLPHAMSAPHTHEHSHEHEFQKSHDENMWKGFVAMLGLILFFVMERFIVIVAKWRKNKQLKHKLPKMKVMKEKPLRPSSTSEKQCKHKYSSVPFCYDAAIAMIDKNHPDYPVLRLLGGQDGTQSHNDTTTTTFFELDSTTSELQPFKKLNSSPKLETNQNMTECPSELNASNCTEVNKMIENEKDDSNSVEYTTVILREHENRHHGHSHVHGHVHAAPKDMSSVAWMVIMGDGLHNFTDGMAIGAAFSSSIAGGFSTAVAVFCHELPHELGDFAMLLKAGMSMRQALVYNVLSSLLCLLGNGFGMWLGNTEYASSWVFAVAAGTFIYIALVDMIPELSNGHEGDETLCQCFLQLSGLLVGFAIMTCIAIYEHDLKHMFHEPV